MISMAASANGSMTMERDLQAAAALGISWRKI
jgi:hypothetical protein